MKILFKILMEHPNFNPQNYPIFFTMKICNLKIHHDNFTVWKFQNFFVTQILHETNIGEFRSCKIAIFGYFRGSEFWQIGKFQPSKSAKIHKKQYSVPPNVLKWQILHCSNS